jgi:hypothetical protein
MIHICYQSLIIDTSIIHDTVAVIANEVKQPSKTKMHFFKPSGLPRRLRLLAMTGHSGFPEFAGMTYQFFNFP